MAGITCCMDCSERVLGCHSTCQKYIQEKEEYKKVTHQKFLYEVNIRAGMKESIRRMTTRRSSNGIICCHKHRKQGASA